MNLRAVRVLITTPIPAVIITGRVWTWLGSINRRTDSEAITPTATSSSTALVKEARMVALRMP
jgi:hypothetical protein